MGKSALATEFSLNAARAGWPTLLFSLEMTPQAIARRAIASDCYGPRDKIAYSKIKAGAVSNAEMERVAVAAREFRTVPIEIEHNGKFSITEISARSKKYAASLERTGKKLGLIIVDHMHIVKATSRYGGNKSSRDRPRFQMG